MRQSGVLSATMFAPNLAMCADWAPKGRHAIAFAGFNIAGSLGFLCDPLLTGAWDTFTLPVAGEIAAYCRISYRVLGSRRHGGNLCYDHPAILAEVAIGSSRLLKVFSN